jgi:hypothetical protein
VLPPAKNKGILEGAAFLLSPNFSPEGHMAVSLKFPAAALALLIAGCSSLPTETDSSMEGASAVQNATEAASDSSTSRTGNLFGSGT